MRLIVVVVFGLLVSACSGGKDELPVSEANFDGDWPLTVSEGKIRCGDGAALLFSAKGKAYALNGVASQQGYEKIDPIWRTNPKIPGSRISLRDLIDMASKHC